MNGFNEVSVGIGEKNNCRESDGVWSSHEDSGRRKADICTHVIGSEKR